jgi:hypothetical protein
MASDNTPCLADGKTPAVTRTSRTGIDRLGHQDIADKTYCVQDRDKKLEKSNYLKYESPESFSQQMS